MEYRLSRPFVSRFLSGCFFALALLAVPVLPAAGPAGPAGSVESLSGTVEIRRANATAWEPAYRSAPLGPGDAVRTGERSRATLLLQGRGVVPLDEISWIELPAGSRGLALRVLRGIIYFFHRGEPVKFEVLADAAAAMIEGTEFVFAVQPDGGVEVAMFDGRVLLTNAVAGVTLTNGQVATVRPGGAPQRTAVLTAGDFTPVQWSLYYPGVLVLADLGWSVDGPVAAEARDSLRLYGSGALPAALAAFPPTRQPATADERVFLAALLLANGRADAAQKELAAVPPAGKPGRLANALRLVIATVVRGEAAEAAALAEQADALPTELLAASYALQSQSRLDDARAAARRAAELAPTDGLALARLAELEFSFGRIREARGLVTRSLEVSPDNAEALALRGFLAAADNRLREAAEWFDRALDRDGALGNAWLGRGLARIRRGGLAAGTTDLMIAAATEPQRAVLRSYLGKAFADARENELAEHEFGLAERLDPGDPTAPLYRALMRHGANRVNEAIADLERARDQGALRGLFRSSLLLDQDRAVSSANLARIYQDAGLQDVATREAARALAADYSSHSAHLFLANTFAGLRDPNLVNLRYETATVNEYLIANLLSPVGAGTLSPTISQQEYGKLFERDRVGVVSATEYLSRGAWVQDGSLYGQAGQVAGALEGFYRSDPGEHTNGDIEQRQVAAVARVDFSHADSVYLRVYNFEAEGGDVRQLQDPAQANPTVRFEERQDVGLTAGYRHTWQPGVVTLALFSRIEDDFGYTNAVTPSIARYTEAGAPSAIRGLSIDQRLDNRITVHTAELQQIWQHEATSVIGGGRIQWGDSDIRSLQDGYYSTYPEIFTDDFGDAFPADNRSLSTDLSRYSAYVQAQQTLWERLTLIGGVTFDHLEYPLNPASSPVVAGTGSTDHWSPKAGLLAEPWTGGTLRAAWFRSLGGGGLDSSVRLEPATLAGFVQAYRSLAPESLVGAKPGAENEGWAVAFTQDLPSRTYITVGGQWLSSEVAEVTGLFLAMPDYVPAIPGTTRRETEYQETSFSVTAGQLIGKHWSVGLRYAWSLAELDVSQPDFPAPVNGQPEYSDVARQAHSESTLHRPAVFAIFNHGSGFFAATDLTWWHQDNANDDSEGTAPAAVEDSPWNWNAVAGWRSVQRRLEVSTGILNLLNEDHRLSPLSAEGAPPRERTLFVRLRLSF
ncbi:MAG: TonB-dependent receptor domain-containing protein [Limisphaerales bacterium]